MSHNLNNRDAFRFATNAVEYLQRDWLENDVRRRLVEEFLYEHDFECDCGNCLARWIRDC